MVKWVVVAWGVVYISDMLHVLEFSQSFIDV